MKQRNHREEGEEERQNRRRGERVKTLNRSWKIWGSNRLEWGKEDSKFPFVRAFIISTTSHHLSFLFISFLVFFFFFFFGFTSNPYISSKFWSTVFTVVLISLHGFHRSILFISDPTKIQKIFVNFKIFETDCKGKQFCSYEFSKHTYR